MFNNLGAIGNRYTARCVQGPDVQHLHRRQSLPALAQQDLPARRDSVPPRPRAAAAASTSSAARSRTSPPTGSATCCGTSPRPAGIAFQLALGLSRRFSSGGLTKWTRQGLETWINNARINSCETATALRVLHRPRRSAATPSVPARSWRCRWAWRATSTPPCAVARRTALDPRLRTVKCRRTSPHKRPLSARFTWRPPSRSTPSTILPANS